MVYRHLLTTALLSFTLAVPGLAHEVKFAEDVGATLHIEPDDIAKAGSPTELWFALTKVGGRIIPLEACECNLTLYASQNEIVATPSLYPTSAEGFSNIPGATVTFPEVGAYTLLLSGAPTAEEDFAPFELRFDVTVAQRAANTPVKSASTSNSSESPVPPPETTDSPEVTVADNISADSGAMETPGPTSASSSRRFVALGGGSLLLIGLLFGILNFRQSLGGKP